MESDWHRAFVHESGHAIMAAMQTIPSYGIFLQKPKGKACNPIDPLPPPSDLSDKLRLYLAAGNAAERIIFVEPDLAGSGQDRKLFGNPQGVTFDEKVKEAEAILLNKRPIIERLASRLHELVKKADYDFSRFRSRPVNSGGVIEDYWVLLCEKELKEELKDVSSR